MEGGVGGVGARGREFAAEDVVGGGDGLEAGESGLRGEESGGGRVGVVDSDELVVCECESVSGGY